MIERKRRSRNVQVKYKIVHERLYSVMWSVKILRLFSLITLLVFRSYLADLVPTYWHDPAKPLAQLCQCVGTSVPIGWHTCGTKGPVLWLQERENIASLIFSFDLFWKANNIVDSLFSHFERTDFLLFLSLVFTLGIVRFLGRTRDMYQERREAI